jgi:chitin disaccharide deacetylase
MVTRALVRRLARLKVRGANAFFQFHVGLLGSLSRVRRISLTSATNPPQPQRLAERLGYEPGERLLIVHADDLAIAHAVNAAIVKGLGTGLITSASVMVPCPWFPEVAAFAREHPEADLGIHLTLTSERAACRWGPTAPRTKVPSLVDSEGYFHQTWTHATPISAREVELELRAQIDKAFDSGLLPTHLDSHQYRLQMSGPRLFEVYLRLGHKYNLPIFVARDWFTQFPYLQRSLTTADVIIDHTVAIEVEIPPQEWPAYYRRAIESLQPGITQFVIHPGLDTAELRAFSAERKSWGAAWRQRDFDFFTSEEFRYLLAVHNVKLITWRDLAGFR